jgi:tetratricopeptide (TPR) repeat protein
VSVTADGLVAAAHAAGKKRRFSEAIEKAKAALELEPEHERARIILANALDNSGRPREAAQVVAALLQKSPDQVDFLYWHSVLLRKSGRVDAAVRPAARFVQLRPESAEAHGNLGGVLAAVGRVTEAADSLVEAVRLNPNFAPYRYNLALLQIQLGKSAEAEALLLEVVAMAPEFSAAHLTLGEQYLKRAAIASAVAEAQLAVNTQPESGVAHLLLARALTEQAGKGAAGVVDTQAEQHIRKALALDPKSSAAHTMLGFALQEKGEFDAAEPEFREALRLDPRQGAVYYGLATCRKYSSDDAATVQLLEGAVRIPELAPANLACIHYALAKVLEDQKQYERSLAEYEAANRIMFESRSARRPFDARENEHRVTQIIDTFSAEFIESQKTVGSDSELPLFVVGMMRSGTTLVEQILSSHPHVAGGGELMFWHENAGRVFAPGHQSFNPDIAESVCREYISRLREIGPKAARVTDKLPENYLYLGLIHTLFPNARIVHCRRHPVDTCLSIYATPYTSPPDFVYMRENIVAAYRQYQRVMAHWRQVLPSDRLLEVDYEHLVADRENVTRQLVGFAGLDWDDACLHHEQNSRIVKTPSRWQVRQPIFGSSVERWKNFEPWLGAFSQLMQVE